MMIHHIGLWVLDMENMKAFYTRYFAANAGEKYTNPNTGFQSCFLHFHTGAKLELMYRPDVAGKTMCAGIENPGGVHIAFHADSVQQVDTLSDILKKDGFNCLSAPRRTGDGFYESVFSDPEGNRIEITA